MKLRLIFLRKHNIGSIAIRGFTACIWSHVGIVTETGTVIDTTAFHGVRERPAAEFLKGASASELVDFMEVTPEEHAAVIEAARSQIGKGYDYLAILGIWFRTKWETEGRWFCSELVAWAINRGTREVFREGSVRGIWPQHLWVLKGLK